VQFLRYFLPRNQHFLQSLIGRFCA
jgi:hypothetical protein